MSNSNMTPDQRAMSKWVQKQAYKRVPETCNKVREILDEALKTIMYEHDIPEADVASLDSTMSRVFLRLRDEVIQPFRTEQMGMIRGYYVTYRPTGDTPVAQLKPCPPSVIEEMKKAFKKNPVQHFVVWDKTYYLNEEGSCRVMDHFKFRLLRRCDGYDPTRYEVIASIGDPPNK